MWYNNSKVCEVIPYISTLGVIGLMWLGNFQAYNKNDIPCYHEHDA